MKYYHSKDLSIVIQGPIHQAHTKRCLATARERYPHAEIILSTYSNENIDAVHSYDKLVLAVDPGENETTNKHFKNINRQIATSIAGIREASRPLVFRVRSDIEFLHGDAVKWFGLWDKQNPKWKMFDDRILTSNSNTLLPWQEPCFICDFAYLGSRGDMLKLFSIPPRTNNSPYGPEQYISTSYFHKKSKSTAPMSLTDGEAYLANNFAILDAQRQLGISCQKYPFFKENLPNNMRHIEWINLYYKHLKNPVLARDLAALGFKRVGNGLTTNGRPIVMPR